MTATQRPTTEAALDEPSGKPAWKPIIGLTLSAPLLCGTDRMALRQTPRIGPEPPERARNITNIPPAIDIEVSLPSPAELPSEFQPRALRRRALQALAALGALVAIFVLAPGLGEVRERLAGASPGWLVAAALLEGLSFASYVVMFGPSFCTGLSWRRSWQIGGSELAMGSLVPASGAGGLALGAWVLHRGGMDGERIARRSVAFFLIKSAVNFVAVAVLGTVLALGLVGPDLSLWLTAFPAALATLALGAVVAIPRLGPGRAPGPEASRLRRAVSAARKAVIDGTGEALQILRSGIAACWQGRSATGPSTTRCSGRPSTPSAYRPR